MTAHAKLSPSAASRWLRCTAAPALEAEFGQESSVYAVEGTLAHRLAELETRYALGWINKAELSEEIAGVSRDSFYTEEMREHAEEYAAYIKSLYEEEKEAGADPFVFLEETLDLTAWIPEGFGTADCVIVADGVLNVIDFKYGKGVRVEAEENPQMKIYALGALARAEDLYDIETVRMTIVQPRLGGVSAWAVPAADLKNWGEETLRPRAEKAFSGDGEFCPSEEACRFCRAAGECRARAEKFVRLFEENEDTEFLTRDEIGELLARAADMEAWLKSLKEAVFGALMDGDPVRGWKLVEGRSSRKYADEDAVAKKLRAKGYKVKDIYEKKLLGITAMEKLVGKKKLAETLGDLIVKPKGSPSLAPADDRRPEWIKEEEIVKAFDE